MMKYGLAMIFARLGLGFQNEGSGVFCELIVILIKEVGKRQRNVNVMQSSYIESYLLVMIM